jgi:membrane fusion protein (multidrug efflux system)
MTTDKQDSNNDFNQKISSQLLQDLNPETIVEEPTTPAKKQGPRRLVLMAGLSILALAAVTKGWGSYTFAQSHVDTDNAYITGDLVNISPQVSGTLTQLNVQDGQFVHKGDLIATLDKDTAGSELAEAQANLLAAQSQIPQAEASLAYTKLSTDAAIQSSRAAIATQNSRTEGSRMQVRLSSDTVRNQVLQAESQVAQAKAQFAQAQSGIGTANAALASSKEAVVTAQNNASAAHSAVGAAQAEADRAAKDLQRYQDLYKTEAVSRQQFDTAQAAATSAAANLLAAQQRAAAADSQVSQAKSGVAQAEQQVNAAKSQAEAASKQVQVAQAGVGLAAANRTQIGIQDSNVRTSQGQANQAGAELQAAQAGVEQIALREKQIATAKAQLQQAQAAVDRAKVRVGQTFLYAPTDGYVVKHTANVGTAINPGQTIVTITRGNDLWVMANFKETQLENVREGQGADIEVDAFPGKKFHGKVLSVLRATGSATTLLPPDNSTGNFTKIVQRVPVKLSVEGSEASSLLRQGMSVVATIDTASKR